MAWGLGRAARTPHGYCHRVPVAWFIGAAALLLVGATVCPDLRPEARLHVTRFSPTIAKGLRYPRPRAPSHLKSAMPLLLLHPHGPRDSFALDQGLAAAGTIPDLGPLPMVPDWRIPSLSLATTALVAMLTALQHRYREGAPGAASRALMTTSGAVSPAAASPPDRVPWPALLQVLAVQFCESFTLQLIIPLLPFMVRDFAPALPMASVGYYRSKCACGCAPHMSCMPCGPRACHLYALSAQNYPRGGGGGGTAC